MRFSDVDKKWINLIPKIINENKCWIPKNNKPNNQGYISIMIGGVRFRLHRLVICIYYNLNYDDQSWVSRHSEVCDRACFNISHLKPGTSSDNANDSVEHETHFQASKKGCPRCGGSYTTITNKNGVGRGMTQRYCQYCSMMRRRKKVKI